MVSFLLQIDSPGEGVLSVLAIFQQLSGNRELFVGLRHYRYVRLRRTEPEGERVRP